MSKRDVKFTEVSDGFALIVIASFVIASVTFVMALLNESDIQKLEELQEQKDNVPCRIEYVENGRIWLDSERNNDCYIDKSVIKLASEGEAD